MWVLGVLITPQVSAFREGQDLRHSKRLKAAMLGPECKDLRKGSLSFCTTAALPVKSGA